MGKQQKINQEANRKLKRIYEELGITRCELCNSDNFLSFAHRHKRIQYRGMPEKLSTYNSTLLLCVPCHQKLEVDKKLTESTFLKLRGTEL